ncbi:hypothetical protein OG2516_00329 [Oceanicola granulosus HTCC2516]|uniref:Acetolactate synthase n=1 Tax=Oceanicola granulosus (strain ATCC BAA-861 / DSM 15982 / KCTC 12143 / HTCC2516) TaxID=314256 RepID=Q2C9Y9_OCEGH|nr:DUF6497 family protein [Oceanicola granulosus]EAR49496.1 hypothetical protein OG2516_00329 [Oceanicola granulosus HTCC2516]
MKRALIAGAAIWAAPLAAAEIKAPSGQVVTLYEVVLEDETRMARFLFLAPGIAVTEEAGLSYGEVQADFPWLCEGVILPALSANAWSAAEVVIAMSDREVAFGERDSTATQFFEVFRIDEGTCVWAGF